MGTKLYSAQRHTMIELVSKLKRCRPADISLLVEGAAFLIIFRVALSLISVKRIIRWTTRGSIQRSTDFSDIAIRVGVTQQVTWAIRTIASQSPFKFVCFPQALAGYCMLRRRGVASVIVYGVGRQNEQLSAHAWLMCEEQIVLGGEAVQDFSPIARWI